MSLEKKIQSLLNERATLPISNMDNGDKKPIPAGSSQNAEYSELSKDIKGDEAATPVAPAEAQANLGLKGDPTKVTTQAQRDALEGTDISALFAGMELAEGFAEKATGLFEAAVVARVNTEVDKAVTALTEQAQAELKVTKSKLEEDVNAYLSYVVESWMKDNQLSVDAGLRTEIAESFIAGLKDLFVENYIEVPEDKVQVVESLSSEVEATKSRLNEEIEKSIALSDKIVKLEKAAVLEQAAKGLAVTDAERLSRLVEGVEFDNQEAFAEKVAVIKEAHFKVQPKKSAETLLAEQAGQGNETKEVSAQVSRYVTALNRNSKF
jgi:hypothetical protein